MIRLDLPRAPYWLDLPYGVRLYVRPADTALDAAARFAAVETVRSAPDAETASRARRIGLAKAALAVAVAQAAILEWEGVLDAEGSAPAPVTPDAIVGLMAVPALAEAFVAAWYAPLERLAAEGEGCGAAPAGTTAAAPIIAGGAEPTVTTG